MVRDVMLQSKIEAMEYKRQRINNRIALAYSIRMIGPERLAEIDFSQIDDQMEQSRRYLDENAEMKVMGERLRRVSREEGDVIAEEIIDYFAHIANVPENEIDQAIRSMIEFVEKHFYPCTDKILIAYARAYGGDGILAQAVDEAGGEGAAKKVRERLENWLKEKKSNIGTGTNG